MDYLSIGERLSAHERQGDSVAGDRSFEKLIDRGFGHLEWHDARRSTERPLLRVAIGATEIAFLSYRKR